MYMYLSLYWNALVTIGSVGFDMRITLQKYII